MHINEAMNPSITICIVHYNKLDKLKNTISTLEDRTKELYRLKILNNGYENENILSYLSKLEQRDTVEAIYNDKNIGCSAGRNKLLEDIETPYAMTLDDDMYVEEGWLETVLDIFSSDSKIAVVGIPYGNPGSETRRGGAYLTVTSGVLDIQRVDWEYVNKSRFYLPVNDVPGGTMVFRTELLNEFNWDAQYFTGMADEDKSLQIMQTDWKQVMATGITFKHDPTTDQEYIETRRDYKERHESYRKFVSKWDCRFTYPRHLLFWYLFRLPWPVMNTIEVMYQQVKQFATK